MTDDHEHPANGPEQEITSEAAEFAAEQAEPTEPSDAPKAAMPLPGIEKTSEGESAEDAAPRAEGQFAGRAAPEGRSEGREALPKLERLQKILAQAGIASRRHAEELITQGRVQVNGQVVIVLGTKADPERDHIRVDGKLLRGAERLRYFVLNKPKGYVTTVTDPEGRPTVMQFFSKMGERLYPVGRLDYQSEGLLLVTNDGELANQLTRAASRVEKTYLVKVAGQPDEEQLDRLRGGVSIDKGGPREGKVHTAAASIRQIRRGDNPWYEVILIEGRNRELRKMFEEIGHHVEKIRRVGYGPLVLDVEPGKVRELEPSEVEALRLTAAGKLKPRRPKATRMLPKVAGKRADVGEERPRRFERPPAGERREGRFKRTGKPDARPKFGSLSGGGPAGPFVKRDRTGPNRSAPDRPFKDRAPRPPGDRRERLGRPEDSRGTRGGPARGAGFGERRPPRPVGRPNADASPRAFEGRRPERAAGFRDRSSERFGPPRKAFGERGPRSGEQRSEGRGQRSPEFSGGRKPYGAGPQRRESGDRPQRRDEGAKPFMDNRRSPGDRPTGRESGERPQRREGSAKPFRSEQRPYGRRQARSEGSARPFRENRRPADQSSPRREGSRPFRGDRRPPSAGPKRRESSEGSQRHEGPPRPFRGERKPGPPFRGKPGGKPGGGPKRSSARPGGKRNFGKRPK